MVPALGKPTRRQQQIIDFVRTFARSSGSPPTVRDICRHFGFKSTNAAREHLRLITQKGFLGKVPRSARGVRTVGQSFRHDEIVRVPILGRIAAGEPISAIEEVESEIPLPRAYYPGRDLFALRVRGDSMIGAGIQDGDIAVIEKQPEVKSGEIAAVVVENDATLKRVFHSAKGIRLHAENRKYADRVFAKADLSLLVIAGRLVGIVRAM